MPIKSDDEQKNPNESDDTKDEPFKGVGKYVESGDVVGLMRELDKVPIDTKEAILNKISMSDGKGGRIELDGHQMIPMPEAIRKQAQEQLKKKRQLDQGDNT